MLLNDMRIMLKRTLIIAFVAVFALSMYPAFAGEEEEIDRNELDEQMQEADERFTEEVQKFLSVELPEALTHLEQQRERSDSPSAGPEQQIGLVEVLIYLADVVEELTDVREYLPEAYEKLKHIKRMEIETEVLAERYRESPDKEEREMVRKEIEGILKQNFLLSQEIKQLEATQIQKELDEINETIKKREENREIIIGRRLHELLHGVDPYEW